MTMTKSRQFQFLCIGLSALLLSACENPIDCIIDDRPILNTGKLTQPVLNQVFESSISVSIQNNGQDDNYRYRWRLSGRLPEGITYRTDHRDLYFDGTATAEGDYPYTVSVDVGDDEIYSEKASNLCRQNVTRDYVMKVAPL